VVVEDEEHGSGVNDVLDVAGTAVGHPHGGIEGFTEDGEHRREIVELDMAAQALCAGEEARAALSGPRPRPAGRGTHQRGHTMSPRVSSASSGGVASSSKDCTMTLPYSPTARKPSSWGAPGHARSGPNPE